MHKQTNKQKLATEQEVADIVAMMQDKTGRRFMWELLSRCGVFQSTFDTNQALMSFNEGRRNIGLYYLAVVHDECADLYNEMVKEARN
jgi:hypothetical protein